MLPFTKTRHINAHFSFKHHNIAPSDLEDNPNIDTKFFIEETDTLPPGEVQVRYHLYHNSPVFEKIFVKDHITFHLDFQNKNKDQSHKRLVETQNLIYNAAVWSIHLYIHSFPCHHIDKDTKYSISTESPDRLELGTAHNKFRVFFATKEPYQAVDASILTHVHLCEGIRHILK